jgi:hypothetical protein
MTSMTSVVYGDGQIIICGGSMRIGSFAHAWPEVMWPEEALFGSMFCASASGSCAISALVGLFHRKWQSHVNGRGPVRPYLFPVLLFPVLLVSRTFSPYFFLVLFSPYSPLFSPVLFPTVLFFSRTIFPYYFFSYCFPVLLSRTFIPFFFPPVLFCSRTFSKVATFEIQRFKISVSCFSSTCRYNTVHVHCGTSIQTSPVGFPLDGWGARMRDLKGPTMNLFNLKEDWNVLLYQPIISLEIEPIRSRHCRPISQSDCKNWTNQKRADL